MKIKSSNAFSRSLFCMILSLCVAVLCQGCDNGNNGTAKGASQKKLRLVFVANTPDDFWSVVRLGCDKATRQLGNVDLDFRFPATPTAAAQQELMNSLVTEGVDGIAVSPIDPDNQTEFFNGIAAKTLLVCVDSDAPKSRRTCYIGIDNFAAGQQAAELLKAALPQGGKIVVLLSYLEAQNTKDRSEGLKAGLAGSKIQIIETLADGAKIDIAQKLAADAMSKYPDLAAIDCLNGYQGPAVLTAVRGAGKAGQLKIVCFDDSSDTLAGIEAGDIFGTIVQPPFNTGYQTVVRMGKQLDGDKTQLAEGKVLLPSTELTKDKVMVFREWRKTMILNAATNNLTVPK